MKYHHIAKLVVEAEARIRPNIRQTLLDHSLYYSQLTGANVYFKCENLQHTGSFKARGALNKILSLTNAERERGIVTASSGNHGQGVAFALSQLRQSALVFVPKVADKSKIAAMERLGAEVQVYGKDGVVTEMYARAYAAEHGMTFISPYNDEQVMAGQGTIGVELARQLDSIDAVLIAVGGGGLIGGIAAYLKSVRPDVEVVGCQPENSQVMKLSVEAGKILDEPSLPTLSDGTAGGIEPDSVTFPVCRDLVDRYVTVNEVEIADSLRAFISKQHMLIEGAAAVPIAALLKKKERYIGRNIVILLCGANIALETLKRIL